MSRSDTWMPLYIGDYLADTMHLGAMEHGAYMLLLMHQWRSGPLPDDDRQLAAIGRVDLAAWKKAVGPVVRRFFTATEDGLVQRRLEAEREKAESITEKRARAGRNGAQARWQKDAGTVAKGGADDGNGNDAPIANAMAAPMANASQSDGPSQSQSQEKKEPPSLPSEARSPRASRLPPDWQPGPDGERYAAEQGLNPAQVAANFRDYWHAKPGAGAVKLDWMATWRTWCRRDAERQAERRAPQPRHAEPPAFRNPFFQIGAELMAEEARRADADADAHPFALALGGPHARH